MSINQFFSGAPKGLATHKIIKNKILITGLPSSGKTTLCKALVESIQANHSQLVRLHGFYASDVRANHSRIGFNVTDLRTNETAVLARVSEHADFKSNHRVSKYLVDLASFEELALKSLQLPSKESANQSIHSSSTEDDPKTDKQKIDVLLIDEIGKMECFSGKFVSAIQSLFSDTSPKKQLIIATIPVPKSGEHAIIKSIRNRQDTHILTVDTSNRASIREQAHKLVDQILSQLSQQ